MPDSPGMSAWGPLAAGARLGVGATKLALRPATAVIGATTNLLGRGALAGLDLLLASPQADQAVNRVLESPLAERTVRTAISGPLVDVAARELVRQEVVERVVETLIAAEVVERVLTRPRPPSCRNGCSSAR